MRFLSPWFMPTAALGLVLPSTQWHEKMCKISFLLRNLVAVSCYTVKFHLEKCFMRCDTKSAIWWNLYNKHISILCMKHMSTIFCTLLVNKWYLKNQTFLSFCEINATIFVYTNIYHYMTSHGYIILIIVDSCMISFHFYHITQLKKSYIATNVGSRKSAPTFGDLPDWLVSLDFVTSLSVGMAGENFEYVQPGAFRNMPFAHHHWKSLYLHCDVKSCIKLTKFYERIWHNFFKEQSMGKILSYVSYGLNHWFQKLHQCIWTYRHFAKAGPRSSVEKYIFCWSNKENRMQLHKTFIGFIKYTAMRTISLVSITCNIFVANHSQPGTSL